MRPMWSVGGVLVMAWGLGCGGAKDGAVSEVCAGLLPGDAVITEFLNDPEGTDTGHEYVEVHATSRAAVDLRGVMLYAARADGSQERDHAFTESVVIPANGYLVLGDVREGPLPEHVDHAYGDALGALGNTSGVLGLRCGERVLDEVSLSAPGKAGVARTYDGRLVPDAEANDDASRWCDATGEATRGFRGSPGEPNAPCVSAAPDGGTSDGGVIRDGGVDAGTRETCVPPGAVGPRALLRPRSGSLVLTEVMANPRGDDTLGEWVEVLATEPVDLNGLSLGTDSAATTFESSRCLSLAAGEYAVLARQREATLNGGLPVPVATFGVDLRNAGGSVWLRSGDTLIDGVSLGGAEDGVSIQVSASHANARDNDAPDAWCRATEPYGARGDLGTPGRANRECSAQGSSDAGVDAGLLDAGSDAGVTGPTCIDRTTGKARALRSPEPGSLVLTEFMADPSAVADTVGEWVEVLALREVDLNGLVLSSESGSSLLSSPLCLTLRAGALGVIARSDESALNGGLPAVLGTFGFNLVNGAGAHWLRLSLDGRMLDTVTYSSVATPGVASQLRPGVRDAVGNDAPSSFCLAPVSARYGAGDRGTPGRENVACAP
ncbi:lamin tail domain-containing protein [Myxococcaceae bacterium JPH2]|nr:lamin tail domain-containing protein [Myxococcaceae bacterium JPH2]